MNETQALAVRAALTKMVSQGWLSICVIDTILKTTGGVPDRQDYQTLKLLHCVSFDEMEPALRAQLPGLVERVVGAAPIFPDGFLALPPAEAEQKTGGLFARLLTKVSP